MFIIKKITKCLSTICFKKKKMIPKGKSDEKRNSKTLNNLKQSQNIQIKIYI